MAQDEECIFCSIVAGDADASVVYQDDQVTAFMDLMPANPGHLLVIPNQHASGLADLPDTAGGKMMIVGRRLADAIRRSGVRVEGVNLFLADGEVAGQVVFHTHLHVIPRYAGDGVAFSFGHTSMAERKDLDELAQQIQDHLG